MVYTLGNKCAKNLWKRIVPLQLIIENVVTCFFWNTVYTFFSDSPTGQTCWWMVAEIGKISTSHVTKTSQTNLGLIEYNSSTKQGMTNATACSGHAGHWFMLSFLVNFVINNNINMWWIVAEDLMFPSHLSAHIICHARFGSRRDGRGFPPGTMVATLYWVYNVEITIIIF